MINKNPLTVLPGDGTVTARNIPAYTQIWEMTAVLPDGRVEYRGTWTDEVSFVERNGQEILRRVQRVRFEQDGDRRRSLQVDEVERDTLLPSYVPKRDEESEHHADIRFDNNAIIGNSTREADARESRHKFMTPGAFELNEPIFDWRLWGILIPCFPLSAGYKAQFLAHDSSSKTDGTVRWYTLDVVDRETIDGGKWGLVSCWVVRVNVGVDWDFWISTDASTAPVIQVRINKSRGYQLWWKPRKSGAL